MAAAQHLVTLILDKNNIMPQSFDQARQAAGFKSSEYVPLSVRENSGNTGLLSKIPGSYASELAKQGPPKASAAPTAGTKDLFVGLGAVLNDYQQQLVKQGKRAIADQYVFEFAPPSIGASTVKRSGGNGQAQDTTTATMQTPNSASKLNSATNSVNKTARTFPIKAGTQIVKVIDDVMRNSSFVTDQQNVEISTATDPVTGLQTQTFKAKADTGTFQWYKISFATQDLGYDNIIRDHAYKITFIITPYAVAQMTSQYFPDSRYRGVHKAYQYWFTGGNTQILHYEQSYNNAFRLQFSGIGPQLQKSLKTDFRDQNRYIYMANSPDQSTGAKNYANEPGNNAASFLYDPGSLVSVRMRIVGDPGWMQQGEVGLGVDSKTFDFSPFNSDGSINYDSQAVMFSVAFNTPDDYDFNTGLVNVNKNNRSGQPQEYYTFQAIKCKSIFSKGRFEQEIEGRALIEKNKKTETAGRPASSTAGTFGGVKPAAQNTGWDDATDGAFGSVRSAAQKTGWDDATDGTFGGVRSTAQKTGWDDATAGTRNSSTGEPPASPQPAPPPKPSTSTGPLLDLTPTTSFGGVNLQTTPTLNPNATGQNLVPQPTKPQLINRET